MRHFFLFSALFFLALPAEADSNYWLWYPRTPPGQPYGNSVVMDSNGHWMSSNGQIRYSRYGTRNASLINPENTNRRNGELAYKAAYQSFVEGPQYGLKNKVEPLKNRGRWIKKITTYREIVLYKDAAGNVAVETPDGKWHVTNSRGDYAYTRIDLPMDLVASEQPRMVAKAEPAKKSAKKKGGRSLASLEKPVPSEKKPEEKPSSDPVFDNPLLPK